MSVNMSSLVLLFAGQGNPVVGMGSDLWDINEEVVKIWDCASDISGVDIRRICLKGPMMKLVQTTHQQIAVTAINLSLLTLCRDKLPQARIRGICGHSVGEYAALYAAGSLSLEDTFRGIHFRSVLMDKLSKTESGSMQAVSMVDFDTLSNLINESGLAVDISCDNSPTQQVIGGSSTALKDLYPLLVERGYDVRKLSVSGAWHTRLMSEGVAQMADFLESVTVREPQHAVLMNVTGQMESDPSAIRKNLALHLTHTVKWTASMQYLLQLNEEVTFVEFSNKMYLANLLRDYSTFNPETALHCRKVWSPL